MQSMVAKERNEKEMDIERVIFSNGEHKEFYLKNIKRCRCEDCYHQALIYCLGISADTRRAINSIYNFESGLINPDCLRDGWITSGSGRVVRLAFNLYTNGMPTLDEYQKVDEKINETRKYTVEDIFCCAYARYFWEAVKIRYPEYSY